MPMGKALGGGSGWVLLTFQPREGSLVSQWAADHTRVMAGGIPVLALDMYEHASLFDHGDDAFEVAFGAFQPLDHVWV